MLHPNNAALASSVPEGIEVIVSYGSMAWEIKLADVLPVPAPRDNVELSPPSSSNQILAHEKPQRAEDHHLTIMSTVKAQKIEVLDIIQPMTAKVTLDKKRGPKRKVLPEDLVKRLASQGQGSKAIAAQLKKQGLEVSYKTIQRILSGQRVLV
jgi:hypothetical protein